MAKATINLSDNIATWVTKANTTVNRIGDLSLLTTSQDSSLVGAITGLDSDIRGLLDSNLQAFRNADSDIRGLLDSNLQAFRNADSDIRGLIDSNLQEILDLDSAIGDRTLLTTDAKNNLVEAINELQQEISIIDSDLAYSSPIGIVSDLNTNTDSNVVAAINELHSNIDSNYGALNPTTVRSLFTTQGDAYLSYDSATGAITSNIAIATTSTVGLASFSSGDFSVSTGAVSIKSDGVSYSQIQNISTANRVLGSTSAGGVISEVQVQTNMIADNAVTAAKIADNAVTEAKIADNAVTKGKMADDAVGQNELENVVTLRILNSSGAALKTLYGAG